MARSLVWTGAAGSDYADPNNWDDTTDGLNPAASAPGGGDTASIATSGSITGSGFAFDLVFGGAPSLAGTVAFGDVAAIAGALTIAAGGTLTGTGTLPAGTDAVAIAAAAGTNGSVLVSGAGALLSGGIDGIAVGGAGSGTLSVAAGGTVLASGAGYADFEPALLLGGTAGGRGAVTVDGAAARLDAAGEINVGAYGAGVLTVENAGTVAVTGTVPDGKPGIAIGDNLATASGTVTVSGGNALLDAGRYRLSVGNIGSGTLLVTQGAIVLASAAGYTDGEDALHLGYYSGGSGSVTVTGAGSTLGADGALLVGVAGTGTLAVSNGGRLSAGGANDGGLGLIVADGGGSGSVSVAGGTLAVGDSAQVDATGALAASGGGTVTIGTALSLAAGAQVGVDGSAVIAIGGAAPVAGAVAVAGALSGAGTISGNVADSGAVTARAGTLAITGSVSGTGTLHVAPDGTLLLEAADSAAITFDAAGGTLDLATPSLPPVLIGDRAPGDTVEVAAAVGATAATVSAGGTSSLIFTRNGSTLGSLGFAGTPALVFDAASGIVTACFAAGTRIATARGEVPVEALRVGDRVALARAPGRYRAVRWIGRQHHELAAHRRPQDVMPVRVRAHAFAHGAPARDLLLSPDHAVHLAGVLIPVRYLLNGATVVQERHQRIAYFHVELTRHDVLLAEGLACESYLDTGNRAHFTAQMGRPGAAGPRPCLPLVMAGSAVRAARAVLLARLLPLGFAITADPGLDVSADGRAVAWRRAGDWWSVALPRGARRLMLRSRRMRPADLDPTSEDRREVGVALRALRLDGAALPLGDARLLGGWLPAEPALRWSDAAAAIDVTGAARIEVRLGDWPRYLVAATRGIA
jgi:collagen type I/II/III/V/XI/XXIV/XXVII alpha